MIVATGRSHEHRPASERVLDDFEAEDARIELGGAGRIANVQDGMVEARDGNAHDDSLPVRGRRVRHPPSGPSLATITLG